MDPINESFLPTDGDIEVAKQAFSESFVRTLSFRTLGTLGYYIIEEKIFKF